MLRSSSVRLLIPSVVLSQSKDSMGLQNTFWLRLDSVMNSSEASLYLHVDDLSEASSLLGVNFLQQVTIYKSDEGFKINISSPILLYWIHSNLLLTFSSTCQHEIDTAFLDNFLHAVSQSLAVLEFHISLSLPCLLLFLFLLHPSLVPYSVLRWWLIKNPLWELVKYKSFIW